MAIDLNEIPLSDPTDQYMEAGLPPDFIGQMAKVVAAMQTAGYAPYDQLYGYCLFGNDQYITRFGNAREIVKRMSVKDIKTFLKQYKNRK